MSFKRRLTEHWLRTVSSVGLASALAFSFSTAVFAQDAEEDAEAAIEEAEDEAATEDTIVVTGSRIRRDEFTATPAPVQIISSEDGARVGLADTQSLIAQSPVVSGTQLDLTTQTGSPTAAVAGVPVNGPGSSTIALRGLGAERTLLLANGRRLSPSGVRGAPIAPDLNLIPSSLIDRVEILTDGASSIYGADAVAGVVNMILRNDFEGFELSAFNSHPEKKGGTEQRYSMIGGASTDRARFTLSGEFRERTQVTAGDRPEFTDGCLQDIDVNQSGEIFKKCVDGRPDNAALIASQGFVFRTPGETDIGVPGWSTEDSLPGGEAALLDLYNLQDEERSRALLQRVRGYSVYGTGEYDLDFHGLDTVYVEFLYSNRQNVDTFPNEQVFPGVPGSIPQEILVDALDEEGNPIPILDENDEPTGEFVQQTVIKVDEDGRPILVDNPLNPFDEDALPVVSFADLPQRRETNIEYFRAVGGIKGDIPFGFFADHNWTYDVYGSYDRSTGFVDQALFFEPNILLALETLRFDPDGNLICGVPLDTLNFGFVTPQECVPINFFADSIYTAAGGDKTFATQEETDFITGRVTNFTELEQAVLSGYVTGDLFDLPAGTMPLALGLEFRENRIDTRNSVSREAGFQSSEIPDIEGPTVGRTSIFEIFGETEIPLIKDRPFIREFTITPAVRWTEEENFGAQVTWKVGALWRTTDWLTIRSTVGTSFRAPNLREQFLSGSTGTIGGGNDPCVVPAEALDGDGNYVPEDDPRDTTTLENCELQGADPTQLGTSGVVGIPTLTAGNPEVKAETSENFTAGLVFSQPWTEAFDLDFSITYFDIEVENSVEEFSAVAILAECFDEPGLTSPFCDLITRVGSSNPLNNFIAEIDESFINVGRLTSEGLDFNLRTNIPFEIRGQALDLFTNTAATYQFEAVQQISEDTEPDDRVGEIGFSELRVNATAGLRWNNFTLLWRGRFIDGFQQDDTDDFEVIPADELFHACPIGDTCRDVDFGDSVFYHDVSLTYIFDTLSLTFGVANLTNQAPPLIDAGEGQNVLNAVTQAGYDFIGRRYFFSLVKSF